MESEPLTLLSPWEQRISDVVSIALQSDRIRQSEHFTFLDPNTIILVYTSLRDVFTATDDQVFERAGAIDATPGALRTRYPTPLLTIYDRERVRLMHESGIVAEIAATAATLLLRGELAQREFSLRFLQEHVGQPHGLLRSELHHHGLMTALQALSEVSYRLYES